MARGYVKGIREDVREEKDGGGKEESKGKSGCALPETKSWLRHCLDLHVEDCDLGFDVCDLDLGPVLARISALAWLTSKLKPIKSRKRCF